MYQKMCKKSGKIFQQSVRYHSIKLIYCSSFQEIEEMLLLLNVKTEKLVSQRIYSPNVSMGFSFQFKNAQMDCNFLTRPKLVFPDICSDFALQQETIACRSLMEKGPNGLFTCNRFYIHSMHLSFLSHQCFNIAIEQTV